MIARTEAALIRRLAVTRAALLGWRKNYADAPKTLDVAAWEDFIAQHDLGRRAPRRATLPRGLRSAVEEQIFEVEHRLFRASQQIKDCAPERYARFEAARRKIIPFWETLWAQAAKL